MIWRADALDVFFLSYDEPAADRHFVQLQRVSPRPPQRVHGVAGLHNAYDHAARASRTERFLTVDADSFVMDDTVFRATLDDEGVDDLVFAFPARNAVNALRYGNGSVKCWSKRAFIGLRTHERTPPGAGQIDFHQALPYRWLSATGSINRFACDPFHAFRAGYREAIKLSTGRGTGPPAPGRALTLSDRARRRITAWVTIGLDVEHGDWAIYGARRGLIDFWLGEMLTLDRLNDFAYFAEAWRTAAGHDCGALIAGTASGMALLGLPETCLDAAASRAAKDAMLLAETVG